MISATPGPFAVIDYSKSDVWAAGAIAYELFTGQNPFHANESGGRALLNSRNYREQDLPPLPDGVPDVVRRLIYALLSRSPNKVPINSIMKKFFKISIFSLELVELLLLSRSPIKVPINFIENNFFIFPKF